MNIAATEALLREPYRRNSHSEEYGMSLPAGKTCGDCAHMYRCQLIFGRLPFDEVCDWSPSRFRPRAVGEVKE